MREMKYLKKKESKIDGAYGEVVVFIGNKIVTEIYEWNKNSLGISQH